MTHTTPIRMGLYLLCLGGAIGCSGNSSDSGDVPDSGDVLGAGGSFANAGRVGSAGSGVTASGGNGATAAGGSAGALAYGGTCTSGPSNSAGSGVGGTVGRGGSASGGVDAMGGTAMGGTAGLGGAMASGGRAGGAGGTAMGGTAGLGGAMASGGRAGGAGGTAMGGSAGLGGAMASGGRTGGAGANATGGASVGGQSGIGGQSATGGNVGNAGGGAGSSSVCKEPPTIFALPADFGRPHATKALLACGVYVIASSAVADAALFRAQQILQVALLKICTDIPTASSKFTSSKSRTVILGKNEDQSIYWPNASGRRSFCSWPDANGMIENTTLEEELTSGSRAQLMTTVHETGHFAQFALYLLNRPLYDRSVAGFKNCNESLYNDYDLQNEHEFFAGDALRWFDLNPSDLAVSDSGTLSQRAQLKKYSPTMYQIMSETFVTTAIP